MWLLRSPENKEKEEEEKYAERVKKSNHWHREVKK